MKYEIKVKNVNTHKEKMITIEAVDNFELIRKVWEESELFQEIVQVTWIAA